MTDTQQDSLRQEADRLVVEALVKRMAGHGFDDIGASEVIAKALKHERERALDDAEQCVQAARCGEADTDLRSIASEIRALKEAP